MTNGFYIWLSKLGPFLLTFLRKQTRIHALLNSSLHENGWSYELHVYIIGFDKVHNVPHKSLILSLFHGPTHVFSLQIFLFLVWVFKYMYMFSNIATLSQDLFVCNNTVKKIQHSKKKKTTVKKMELSYPYALLQYTSLVLLDPV